jgi:hypothetical protein
LGHRGADQRDGRDRRLLGRAGVIRRLRVVLDRELNRLRDLVAGDATHKDQRHVDPRGNPRRCDHATLLDDPLARRRGAVLT